MEASQVFSKLINDVQNSKLNYVIVNKIPFSATLSIKSSFVKYYSDPSASENSFLNVLENVRTP